ncbi:MAG: hypothetical protein A2132_02930 [Nitrospirae bacterium RBG_16_43_11]|nr:MAG: hypothetical protein A2132_02930 [Nitrospirae bacterium RBG_16_43_11]
MIFRVLAILATCVFLWTSAGVAATGRISDILITRGNNELLVSARLTGGFTPEIKKEIINGVSKEFFYYLVIKRVMSNWLDAEKISGTIKYSIKYDILKKQYLVTRETGDLSEEQIFDSYDSMVAWVSGVDRISITPFNLLNKKLQYYVSIKAEMKAGELPFLLRYLFFFVPYSRFSTEWYDSVIFMLKDLK